MKHIHLLPASLLIMTAFAFTSCQPSRVWAVKDKDKSDNQKEVYAEKRNDYEDRYDRIPPPPPTPRYVITTPLILTPSEGFVMKRYPDGRYYHRSSQGFTYWKAYDNRFYLDRSYIHRVRYDRFEYQRWKEYQETYATNR